MKYTSIKKKNQLDAKSKKLNQKLKVEAKLNTNLNRQFKSASAKINKKYADFHKKTDLNNNQVVLPSLNVLDETEFQGLRVKDKQKYIKKLNQLRVSDFSKTTKSNAVFERVPENLKKVMKEAKEQGRNISEGMAKTKALTRTVREYTDKMPVDQAKLIKATKGLTNKLKEISARESKFGELFELTDQLQAGTNIIKGAQQLGNAGPKGLLQKANKLMFDNELISKNSYNVISKTLNIPGMSKESLLKDITEYLTDALAVAVPEAAPLIKVVGKATEFLEKAKELSDSNNDDEEIETAPNENDQPVEKEKLNEDNIDDYVYDSIDSWQDLLDAINFGLYQDNVRNNKTWQRFVDILEGKIRGFNVRNKFAKYMEPFIPDLLPSVYEYGSDNNNLRLSDSLDDVLVKLVNRYHEWLNIKDQKPLKEVPKQ